MSGTNVVTYNRVIQICICGAVLSALVAVIGMVLSLRLLGAI